MLESLVTQDLWHQYRATRDRRCRDQLIARYLGIVHHVSSRLAHAQSAVLDRDDLIHEGTIGLMQAVDRYDPGAGVPFVSYAIPRVRGHILDAVRRHSCRLRGAASRARLIEETRAAIERDTAGTAGDRAVMDALGLTPAAYYGTQRDAHLSVQSLDALAAAGMTGLESRLGDRLIDRSCPTPEQALDRRCDLAALAAAIGGLSDRQRRVLSLYYHDEWTLKEIGRAIGVSESRVSQIHSQILRRLRAAIEVAADRDPAATPVKRALTPASPPLVPLAEAIQSPRRPVPPETLPVGHRMAARPGALADRAAS